MANELDEAVQAGLSILRDISGLRSAHDFSPENPASYPMLIGSAFKGTWQKGPSGEVKGLHTVRFGIYKPRKDLPRDIETMMPFGELVKDKFFLDSNAGWNGKITAYNENPMGYTFGDMEYMPGVTLLGWTFEVPIKINSIQSGTQYIKG